MQLDHFRTFARYNRWANDRLYSACASLSEADYLKPRESFFGSIHATLNHLLVGDRIWMGRLTRHDPGIKALNQILYADFSGLRVARSAEDAQIIAFVDGLDAPTLNGALRYKSMAGKTQSTPVRWVLAHLFNHQTHHRGQAHGLLSQTMVKPPELDLLYFLREMPTA
ncbi:MAG: damage-inducible protein DinB [Alphaproteobacteria bacterium]|nr:damage-inducible protein DinB [Alphaproteobacteria bacterium]